MLVSPNDKVHPLGDHRFVNAILRSASEVAILVKREDVEPPILLIAIIVAADALVLVGGT